MLEWSCTDMLYDILPPLVLFGSLGGIIFLVSRVVGRLGRHEVVVAIRREAALPGHLRPERVVRLHERGVQPIHSRLLMIKTAWRGLGQRLQAVPFVLRPFRHARNNIVQRFIHVTVRVRRYVTKIRLDRHTAQVLTNVSDQKSQMEPTTEVAAKLPSTSTFLRKQLSVSSRDTSKEMLVPKRSIEEKKEGKAAAEKKAAVPSAPPATLSPSILASAQESLAAARYQQVEELLVPYLAEHTKDTAAYMVLGRAALGQESWQEALEIFEQVVRLNDREPEAHACLGFAAFKSGKFSLALQTLQRAQNDDPEDTATLEYLLAIAKHMDNRPLQRSVLERLIELNPQDAERNAALAALKEPAFR